jgi:Domain of unknown function (DUF4332)
MRYKFEDIEGIGRAYGSKLSKAGFNATDDLLKQCGSAKGRRQVAAASGLDEGQLLKWANMADLMRIRGIGKQFSECSKPPASIRSRNCAPAEPTTWRPR